MIDIQNEVFTNITNALKLVDANVETSSVYTNTPSSYPFVGIEEIDNVPFTESADCCDIENHAEISFEIDVRAKGDKRKSDCYRLLGVADNYLKSIKFTRLSMTPMQDQNDTLFRIVARYSAVVGKDHTIYRR